MKKTIALIALLACLLITIPASAASVVGYWKGPISMTLKHNTYNESTKIKQEVKIAFAQSGAGSFRYTSDSDRSFIGSYTKIGSRFSFTGTDNGGSVMLFNNMSIKLSGNKMTLKGKVIYNDYYANNATITLSRMVPTVVSIKSNKVARNAKSTITVKTDQFTDRVYMTDSNGVILDSTSTRLSGNKWKLYYNFSEKTNKVKIYTSMTTRDGFIFRSSTKSAKVKCK